MAFETKLTSSCQTFALLNTPIFISAFPSYVVFGKTLLNLHYEENCYFKFGWFEASKLLINIFYIGSFLTNEIDSANGIIIQNCEEKYFWMGSSVIIDNEPKKFIKFCIEKNSELSFVIQFTVEELNNFIDLFKRCLIACLCLKEIEEQFIQKTIDYESCENIVLSKTNLKTAKELISNFFKDGIFTLPDNVSNLIQILNYYNETILVAKQLQALYVTPIEDNTALILANL